MRKKIVQLESEKRALEFKYEGLISTTKFWLKESLEKEAFTATFESLKPSDLKDDTIDLNDCSGGSGEICETRTDASESRYIDMPIKVMYGPIGHLIEFREHKSCPYVIGLEASNTIMYLAESSVTR